MKQRIEKKIKDAILLESLEVENKSHLHKGHLGDDGSGETHFKIIIKSKELKEQGRIAAHRKINNILKDEFLKGLHALEIDIDNSIE
jgi:BolA protein